MILISILVSKDCFSKLLLKDWYTGLFLTPQEVVINNIDNINKTLII